MHLQHDSQSRIITNSMIDYCLTQQQKGKFNCSPSLMLCKGNFGYFFLKRSVLSNDTVTEGSRQCLDEGVRMFSAFVTLLVGKHWNHSHKGTMAVSRWLMGRTSPNGRSYSDFKIWIWVFIFTWDCKQHFPPGTKSSNSQLFQILICESEECLKINLWVKK